MKIQEITEAAAGVIATADRVKAEAEGVVRTMITPSKSKVFYSFPSWEKNDTRSTHSLRIKLVSLK